MSPIRLLVTSSALGAAIAMTGCAGGDPSSPLRHMETGKHRQCLMAPLDTTKVIDDHTLLMVDGHGNGALAVMSGACLIDPTAPVLMKFHGTSDICGPLDVDISGGVVGGIPTPCIVNTIKPLTKDETKGYMNGPSK